MKKLFILFITLSIANDILSQNVGIGTATPGAKLQINHRNTVSAPSLTLFDSAAGTGNRILFTKEGFTNNFSIVSTHALFAADNTLDIRSTFNSGILLRGNKVGINNVANPEATLHVGGGVKISDTLNVTGNVRVDTIKPNALKLFPDAGPGKVLTSDAAGNASWKQQSSAGGGVGFGSWGDCSMNSVSEYQPMIDSAIDNNSQAGESVAISGNHAIVGSPGYGNGGGVFFYMHNGTKWMQIQTLISSSSSELFGNSVAISGNYAIAGAPLRDGAAGGNQGSVKIYQFNGSSWVLMQEIFDATGAANDEFGTSVSISGNHIIVGAPLDDAGANTNQGSVSFYRFNGSSWVLVNKMTDAQGQAADQFGYSVSLYDTLAIVGAPFDDLDSNPAIDSLGSALTYRFNGTNWLFVQKLVNVQGTAASDHNWGTSVSISSTHAAIGVPGVNAGAIPKAGSVFMYKRNINVWSFEELVSNPAVLNNERFGTSVFLSGNYLLAGTPGAAAVTPQNGTATLYFRLGSAWLKRQTITDPMNFGVDFFGNAVGFDASTNRFLIGAPNFNNGQGKAVFGKIN